MVCNLLPAATCRALEYAVVKAAAELKAENGRYWLGCAWWLFEPGLQLVTLYVIFGIFLQRGGSNYLSFLLVGIVVWKGITSIIQHAAPSVMQHRSVLMQTALAEWVFPLSAALADGVKLCGLFAVLLGFLGIFHGTGLHVELAGTGTAEATRYSLLTVSMMLPVLLCVLFVFATGVGLLLAALVPLVPDLRFVVESLLQLGFWAAGVFFSASELPASLQPLLYANPAASLIISFRQVLLDGVLPDWRLTLYPLAVGCVCLFIGLHLLHRLRGEYVKL